MILTIIPTVKNIMRIMPLTSALALLAVLILFILVVQEFTATLTNPRIKALQQVLNIIAAPLLVCFVLTAGIRIYQIIESYYQYLTAP